MPVKQWIAKSGIRGQTPKKELGNQQHFLVGCITGGCARDLRHTGDLYYRLIFRATGARQRMSRWERRACHFDVVKMSGIIYDLASTGTYTDVDVRGNGSQEYMEREREK